MSVEDLFSEAEKLQIKNAVKMAELETSGEIRVHIEQKCKADVLDRAAYIFEKLEMHKTALRNGVLFYLAVDDRKFAIIGDAGINSKVPEDFWGAVKEKVFGHFKKGDIADGLSEGVKMAGFQLKTHFPYNSDDTNELDDEISFGGK